METRIEKMNLETLGAVEREREREREYLTNNYVNYLLKQASFSDAQNQENRINKLYRDSEWKHNMFMFYFAISFCVVGLENNYRFGLCQYV